MLLRRVASSTSSSLFLPHLTSRSTAASASALATSSGRFVATSCHTSNQKHQLRTNRNPFVAFSSISCLYHRFFPSHLPQHRNMSSAAPVASSAPVVAISSHDPSSFANNRATRVKHSHFALTVSFASSTLSGHVDHTIEILKDTGALNQLVLDSMLINVSKVELVAIDGTTDTLEFTKGKAHEVFGEPLVINLQANARAGMTQIVRVSYTTSPNAGALQWLAPSQTKGGVHPYLFSQAQAIHCRSMVPIQDTPSNKFTYSANITVDAPLQALMSAGHKGKKEVDGGKKIEYAFDQPVPIPSYLLAIAVGKLESRKIGPRSHVWSEAETVEAGAHEFAETEKFIAAAEEIVGPYVWGVYDILLMPPSFPYGGMENPMITYVTPTLIAGDRSLANVVAHEIAHSWFGNLVTSETWESFWMNEGFTVFLERKIQKSLYGKPHQDLHAAIGLNDLRKSVDNYGESHPFTCLCPRLHNVDPDDAFSSVPYEKGFNFLTYLEALVGGEAVMNPFLRAHCTKFANSTVNSADWKVFFLDYMTNTAKVSKEKLDSIDWDTWYNKPGMPCVANVFDQTLVRASEELAAKLASNGAPQPNDLQGWDSAQIVILLERILDQQKLNDNIKSEAFSQKLRLIDSTYKLTETKNSEIRFRWLTLCIRQHFVDRFPAVAEMLASQGRMKFTRPLYRDLYKSGGEEGKKFAVETFKKYEKTYHSICGKMVARDLELA